MHDHSGGVLPAQVIAIVGAAAAIAVYLSGALRERSRRTWPAHRIVLWGLGCTAALAAVAGPLADAGHHSLPAHMVGHVLLGMLAPLLLVLSRPVTLALRCLDVIPARRLSALLKSMPARVLVHPVTATTLNVGGLWVLYATGLFHTVMSDPLLMVVVHTHVFAAGCLFTAAIIGPDPTPHRAPFTLRAIMLVVALAGHDILAKWLITRPPTAASPAEAETAGAVMYYAGDLVDVAVLVILWAQWHTRARPRTTTRTSGSDAFPGGARAAA